MPHHPWDTPPNGDFAAYVERLTALSAQRSLMAQRAVRQAAAQTFDAPQPDAVSMQRVGDPGAADQAQALFAPPGLQLPTEHPLTRGLRQVLRKIESNLQDMAQQQQQKQKK